MEIKSVPVSSISLDPANVRLHPDKNLEAIKGSLRRFGQQKPIVVDRSGVVRAGNGTLTAAISLGWETINIVETDLESTEATAYAIADNRTSELATWDEAALSQQLEQLRELDAEILDSVGFDSDDMGNLSSIDDGVSDHYSRKIDSPIYQVTGDKPKLSDLYSTTKTDELLAAINQADIPKDIAEFLQHAASRHTVFNYKQIAEYYAHAPAEIQRLMESSVLVIIDFEQAIENGFVKMSTNLFDQAHADD